MKTIYDFADLPEHRSVRREIRRTQWSLAFGWAYVPTIIYVFFAAWFSYPNGLHGVLAIIGLPVILLTCYVIRGRSSTMKRLWVLYYLFWADWTLLSADCYQYGSGPLLDRLVVQMNNWRSLLTSKLLAMRKNQLTDKETLLQFDALENDLYAMSKIRRLHGQNFESVE